jgi:segregation and condensation protein A
VIQQQQPPPRPKRKPQPGPKPTRNREALGAPGTAPGEAAPAPARAGRDALRRGHGQAVTELPKDLYIPPQALEVFLEAFEGPLDLLLYLIRRQNLDILDIDVSAITEQYMQYVELMDAMQFELAAEYLLMAAMLAEIKSRMLLPRSVDVEEDEEEDPRAQLIRRLQEYERFKKAAEDIEELPRMERDNWIAQRRPPGGQRAPAAGCEHARAAAGPLGCHAAAPRCTKATTCSARRCRRVSACPRCSSACRARSSSPSVTLFSAAEGRLGVVVTFLAIMELIKESLVEIVQTENFGPIHVKARGE